MTEPRSGIPPRLRRALGVLSLVVAAGCGRAANEASQSPGSGREPTDAPTVEQGRDLYGRSGCAVCHGEQGRGDGRIAQTLRPPPRDFGALDSYRQGRSVAEIASTIAGGVAGSAAMPAYPHLSPEQRRLIALYVRHLAQQR